jgi:hypothetical protein
MWWRPPGHELKRSNPLKPAPQRLSSGVAANPKAAAGLNYLPERLA